MTLIIVSCMVINIKNTLTYNYYYHLKITIDTYYIILATNINILDNADNFIIFNLLPCLLIRFVGRLYFPLVSMVSDVFHHNSLLSISYTLNLHICNKLVEVR